MRLSTPWLSDFYSLPLPALLSREDFVKKYLPQYASDYRSPVGIRLNKFGRVIKSTAGSHKAQVSKRENRIDEAYQAYCGHHKAAVEMDRRTTEPTLL